MTDTSTTRWQPISTIPNDDEPHMMLLRHYDNERREWNYRRDHLRLRHVLVSWEPIAWFDVPDPPASMMVGKAA